MPVMVSLLRAYHYTKASKNTLRHYNQLEQSIESSASYTSCIIFYLQQNIDILPLRDKNTSTLNP